MPTTTSNPPPTHVPLPTLSPADAARLDLLAHTPSLLALSRNASIPITDLIIWSTRPDIAPWLNAFRNLRADDLHNSCLNALEKLLEASPTPRDTRLLATTILRELNRQNRAACVSTRPPRGPATRVPPPPRAGEVSSRLCDDDGGGSVPPNNTAHPDPAPSAQATELPPPPPAHASSSPCDDDRVTLHPTPLSTRNPPPATPVQTNQSPRAPP